MKLEDFLKKELNSEKMKTYGHGGGGCINTGQGYDTDHGRIFVKLNGEGGVSIL